MFQLRSSDSQPQFPVANSCSCASLESSPVQAGVIWQGNGKQLRLKDIALMLAPAVWFSAEEPLIRLHELPIPQAHPCDTPSEHPVVYFQAHRINLRGDSPVNISPEDDPDFFDKVESVAIRYYFYYPQDIGMSSHLHDLEAAEFQVQLERNPNGCDRIKLNEVIGFAHGVDWFDNHMRVEEDTKYPVMLLVEKGKHATCPDRNADGIYVAGYDVNENTSDAWGIRDGLGMGRVLLSILLMGKGHTVSRSQPRDPAYRVIPPESLACIPPESRWMTPGMEYMDQYELRSANVVTACEPHEKELNNLRAMMRQNHFGTAFPPRQNTYESVHALSDRMSYTGFLPPISVRLDGDPGLSFVLPGWKFGESYIHPKINWYGRKTSVEALWTPTAAQFFSYYATGGLQSTFHHDYSLVSEFGIKVRFPLETKDRRLLGLGYRFAGVRVGIRNIGVHPMHHQLLVELGAGVW